MLRNGVLALTALVAACAASTPTVVVEDDAGVSSASELGGAIAGLRKLPFGSAYLQSGDRFEALLILATEAPTVHTWYGAGDLALQVEDGRVVYSRGLPLDIAESYAAAYSTQRQQLDCGRGVSYSTPVSALYYTRFRGATEYIAEVRTGLSCRMEFIAGLGYVGEAVRVDERYLFPPHPQPQHRTRWVHPETGALLRLEYPRHPVYPQLYVDWIKPAKSTLQPDIAH